MPRATTLMWPVLLMTLGAAHSHAQPAPLEGTVTLDGKPVPAAAVTLRCGGSQAVVRTDVTGAYRFDTRPPGECTVSVETGSIAHEPQRLAATAGHLAITLTSRRGLRSALDESLERLSLCGTSPAAGAVTSDRQGFRFESAAAGRASGDETGFPVDPFSQAWSLSTALTYTRRNSSLSVGLHASHGVHLPSIAPGGTGAFPSRQVQPSFADVTGRRAWDARVMMKSRLFGSEGTLSGDIFAEGVLPLDAGLQGVPPVRLPASFRPIRSRSFRFGVVISY